MSEISELEQAVDEFAAAMKARLRSKANQGWGGWQGMGRERLGDRMLRNAAAGATKGDKKSLVDTANLAMMIHRAEPNARSSSGPQGPLERLVRPQHNNGAKMSAETLKQRLAGSGVFDELLGDAKPENTRLAEYIECAKSCGADIEDCEYITRDSPGREGTITFTDSQFDKFLTALGMPSVLRPKAGAKAP